MTEPELQHFAWAVARIAMAAGVLGAVLWSFLMMCASHFWEWFSRRESQALRIRDARWRAQWDRARREAHEAGYTGRRAIAYTVNIMKSRRQAIAELHDL